MEASNRHSQGLDTSVPANIAASALIGHVNQLVLIIFHCVVLTLFPASMALAHSGGADNHIFSDRHWSSLPTVEVVGNGESYTRMDGGSVTFEAHIIATLKHRNGRIRSFRVVPEIMTTPPVRLDALAYSWHYDVGDRPNSINRYVDIDVSASVMQTYAVATCNRHADALRAGGRTNSYIFGKTHTVNLRMRPLFTVDFRKGSSGRIISEAISHSHGTVVGVTVKCLKWAGLQIPTPSNDLSDQPPVVKSITLEIQDIVDIRGTCKIRLRGIIRTNRPNTKVRYRFKQYEQLSGILSVTTNNQSWAYYDHTFDVPYNEGGVETGQVQTIAVSPVGESSTETYWMECVKPAATGFATDLPPELKVDLVPEEMILFKGQICPTRVKAIGYVRAKGPVEGTAYLPIHVEGGPALFAGSEIDVENGDHHFVTRYTDLVWARSGPLLQATGAQQQTTPRFKNLSAELFINTDAGPKTYSTGIKYFKVSCKIPRINPGVGGVSDEKADLPDNAGDGSRVIGKLASNPTRPGGKTKKQGAFKTLKADRLSLATKKARIQATNKSRIDKQTTRKPKKPLGKSSAALSISSNKQSKKIAKSKIDFAVTNLALSNKGKEVTAQGVIRNKGREKAKLTYRLIVKNRQGKLLFKKERTASVAPGKKAAIKARFSRKKSRHLIATLYVLNREDVNSANNTKQAKLSVRKKTGNPAKKTLSQPRNDKQKKRTAKLSN